MLSPLVPVTLALTPGPMEMVIVLVVVLLLFGNRLPGAMKSLGQSFVAFKKGVKEGEDDKDEDKDDAQSSGGKPNKLK